MSGRVKIKIKDKKPKIDVFKVIESRFKNMNELRDLIDMDPRKGLVRIRDGAGFREVERGGCLHRNYLNLLEDEGLLPSLGTTLSLPLLDSYHENFSHRHKIHIPNKDQLLYNYRLIHNHHPKLHNFHLKPESLIQVCK